MDKEAARQKEKYKLIGHELVKEGIITKSQLKDAVQKYTQLKKANNKELFGEVLLRLGFIDEKTLTAFLEKYLGIPYMDLRNATGIDPSFIKMLPERMARNLKAIAVGWDSEKDKLIVVMANPLDIIALDTLKLKTGRNIERRFCLSKEIDEAVDRFYGESDVKKTVAAFIEKRAEEKKDEGRTDQVVSYGALGAEDTPVIEFVDKLMANAVRDRASDIHVEPRESDLAIRYRIDGMLVDTFPPPKEMQSAIITRLKLLGDMNIAEQRLPQDGRFKLKFKDRDIDIRMASCPTIYGEKLVLRILDSSGLLIDMKDLGMTQKNIEEFQHILKQAYGMILVTGPTGSGKTTTLYSALSYINTREKNIVTIEDPVEYQISGINQIQTKHQIGLTFAAGLRTVLRQDPDVIMIGEIRDLETLENAIKASLTGHLVLSTIHTNDAPSTILRLMHMGLEPYLISPCLSLIIAQRLVRRICPHCKEKIPFSQSIIQHFEKRAEHILSDMILKNISFYKGKGCSKCNNTGYAGRLGLYEFMVISKRIKRMILEEASEAQLKKAAQEEGMKDILEHGFEKVNEGLTTIEEVLRVTVLEKSSNFSM